MAIHLTPEMLEATYELLRTTPPFRAWGLPHADDVVFHVTRHQDKQADTAYEAGVFTIRLSQHKHKTLASVTLTMAHEMCHVRQGLVGQWSRCDHGRDFKRLAAHVCRHHSFDRGQF